MLPGLTSLCPKAVSTRPDGKALFAAIWRVLGPFGATSALPSFRCCIVEILGCPCCYSRVGFLAIPDQRMKVSSTLSLSRSLSLSLSVSLCLSLSLSLSLSFSLPPSVRPLVRPSIRPCIHPSVHLAVHARMHRYISGSFQQLRNQNRPQYAMIQREPPSLQPPLPKRASSL